MKTSFLPIWLLPVLTLSCAFGESGNDVWVQFPRVPASWASVLGEPVWSLRWFDPSGIERRRDGCAVGERIDLETGQSSPVLAWPYWPKSGLSPGEFRPAGAVSPFGLADGKLHLGWRTGVSALFFRELAMAGTAAKTLPEYFDWPRFEALFDAVSLPEAVRADPWIVDWRSVAAKTRSLGFDWRRLVSSCTEIATAVIPADGMWIGISPFSPPESHTAGEEVALAVPVSGALFASRRGLLRCFPGGSGWFPFPE